MKINRILLFVSFIFLRVILNAQTISVTGGPTFQQSSFTVSEAGNNFSGSATSNIATYITISHSNGFTKVFGYFNWRVAVNKSDIYWNSGITLQVRRTADGTGGSLFNNSISGGTSFQTITNTPVTLFSGSAVRNNVPVEFRINNLSVLIPADNFETTIYFTVYSN